MPFLTKIISKSSHKKSSESIKRSMKTLIVSTAIMMTSIGFGLNLSTKIPLNGAMTTPGINAIAALSVIAQTGASSLIRRVKIPVCENHTPK